MKKTFELVNVVCGFCMDHARHQITQEECMVRGMGLSQDTLTEYLDYNGCACGVMLDKKVCRMCPSIRDGVCDGPNVHCEDTKCEYRDMDKCPISRDECKYL